MDVLNAVLFLEGKKKEPFIPRREQFLSSLPGPGACIISAMRMRGCTSKAKNLRSRAPCLLGVWITRAYFVRRPDLVSAPDSLTERVLDASEWETAALKTLDLLLRDQSGPFTPHEHNLVREVLRVQSLAPGSPAARRPQRRKRVQGARAPK